MEDKVRKDGGRGKRDVPQRGEEEEEEEVL